MTTWPPDSPLERPLRLAVLISGGGRTLLNIADHITSGQLNAEVSLVISNQADCAGIERSRAAGFPCEIVPRGQFKTSAEFSAAVFDRIRAAEADLVVLAGFLTLIHVPNDFENRVMNIHPSLIPAFCGRGYYGHRVHEAAIDRGVKISGCTVHFADNEYDHGPIILQRAVDIPDGTTPDALASLVFEQECIAYPAAIQLYASGKIRLNQAAPDGTDSP